MLAVVSAGGGREVLYPGLADEFTNRRSTVAAVKQTGCIQARR
jgi:hypothetical protein